MIYLSTESQSCEDKLALPNDGPQSAGDITTFFSGPNVAPHHEKVLFDKTSVEKELISTKCCAAVSDGP